MSFRLYILRCSDGSYYTGHTDDLERRIAQHQSGEIPCYASDRLPVQLVFSEEFQTRAEALERERQVKGWNRKKKEALIKGNWEEIKKLSRSTVRPSTGSGRTEIPSSVRGEPLTVHGEPLTVHGELVEP